MGKRFRCRYFLDKSPGENNKDKWRWRHCHENCAECFEKGDDIDNKCFRCKKGLYFWCNQTVGNGIPGSCHDNCINNGYYLAIKEDREKCCPCFENCKVCQNSTTCDKCYRPFLLTPEHDRCNKTCGYCLAEDHNLGECVNCKTRYRTPKYTLNKTCVDEIPFIEFLNRYHHIVDDKCNLLHGCKEGCYKCDPWYTDNCTECDSDYYKEDKYLEPTPPEKFHCFNLTTCQGVTPYIHDPNLRIGGVPILDDNKEKLCLNCKKNGSYRLPEDDFYCDDKIDRTYVDIEEYNKLSYCYFRCNSCDYWGNPQMMNCSSCRDSKYYDLFKIKGSDYGNCYRKVHPCGIYPYYHDYDLLGEDVEDCGEACDVCLYNMSCTENFPFLVFDTHECVEYCDMTEIIGNVCSVDQRSGMIFLKNPLGLKDPYDSLSKTVSLNEIYSTNFFKYIFSSYDVNINYFEFLW